MSTPNPLIPPGYRRNAAGHLVPEQTISPLDTERDALVLDIIHKARALQEAMRTWKRQTMGDIYAFVELVAEKYDARLGGAKGNISLRSFDGRYKAEINAADIIVLGPEIHAAKALIDACIHKWTAGSRPEIQALVEHAFQTDKEGRFNVGRIVTLTRLDIDDVDWKNAMRAIHDAIAVVATKTYVRLYERSGPDKPYTQIDLDMAAL